MKKWVWYSHIPIGILLGGGLGYWLAKTIVDYLTERNMVICIPAIPLTILAGIVVAIWSLPKPKPTYYIWDDFRDRK